MAKPSAQQAYQAHQNDIGALLDLIGQEVGHHGEYAKAEGVHWGHCGDLSHVRKCLIEVLSQLAQHDEALIEQHLEEMRG